MMRIEEMCGVEELIYERETEKGTQYRIAKWKCPSCGKACSTLYLDGLWCHGDSMSVHIANGVRTVQCGSCWLGDGHMNALKEAATALACACVDAPKIQPQGAYRAVCEALEANDRQMPPPSDWDAARRNMRRGTDGGAA